MTERLPTKNKETVSHSSLTFAMLKPLGMQEPYRSLIIERLSQVADIKQIKRHRITYDEVCTLYSPSGHNEDGTPKVHFHAITNYLANKEVDLILLHGDIHAIDDMIGEWKPERTREDQLRHILVENGVDYKIPVDVPEGFQDFVYDNLIHSSDSPVSAVREVAIFFTPEELI